MVACGGRPGLLDSVEGLDAADRARLSGFEVVLEAERLTMLVPPSAPQVGDVRPRGLLASGLDRYLPLLLPEVVAGMRDFEERSGMRVLEAFDRVTVWSSAPDVDDLDAGRLELLAAFDGADFIALIDWLEQELAGPSSGSDASSDGTKSADGPAQDGHDGKILMGIFCALDDGQRRHLEEIMRDDPQTVTTHRLGPRAELTLARGVEGDRPWSMWTFVWPGGLLGERIPGDSLVDPAKALPRVAAQLERIEGVARATLVPVHRDRVLAFALQGSDLPGPMDIEVRMGDRVGLTFGMPVAAVESEMPAAQLLGAWPMMREMMANAAQQGMDETVGGFGPLLGRAIRQSTLSQDGRRLVWTTDLDRRDFEALLPTM